MSSYRIEELHALLPAIAPQGQPDPSRRLDVNAALGLEQSQPLPRNEHNEQRVRGALRAIEASVAGQAYPRGDWLQVCWALAALDARHGWRGLGGELALDHSRATPGYTSDHDVRAVLASYDAARTDAVDIGSLFHRARAAGWVDDGAASVAQARAIAEPHIAEMNSRYALTRWGAQAVILDERTPMACADGIRYGPAFIDVAAFRQLLRGRTVTVGRETRPLADEWLKHPQRRQFEGAVFAPGSETPPNVLNLWRGFAMNPREGDVSPWLQLLDALIADVAVRAYVLRWLAWKVQNPGKVPGTILVATGGKGAGKNSLFEPIVRMFGPHGVVFDDAEQVAGRFTGHLMTVAFAVLDEALFVGDPKANDRIKARVTATTMTFEAKGRDPVQGVNRAAYVSLSNHEQVWQATIDERRAVPVEVSPALIGQRDFWSRFWHWLEADGPACLLAYLQRLDLRGFDVRVIPRSDSLRRQVELTALRDPVVAWWHAVLTEGALPNLDHRTVGTRMLNEGEPTTLAMQSLRTSFEATSRRRPGDFPAAMRQLRKWHRISDYRPKAANGDRTACAVFAPLAELRSQFEAATGVGLAAQEASE